MDAVRRGAVRHGMVGRRARRKEAAKRCTCVVCVEEAKQREGEETSYRQINATANGNVQEGQHPKRKEKKSTKFMCNVGCHFCRKGQRVCPLWFYPPCGGGQLDPPFFGAAELISNRLA